MFTVNKEYRSAKNKAKGLNSGIVGTRVAGRGFSLAS